MSYDAEVYKVMVASPSDVSQERQIIREVIYDWNSVHSQDREIVLLPVGWDTHSSPAMGERPQALINKQILDDCDLLVAVFWTRLGSPTGRAASGTVEEIEKHLKARKPAMIYFSSAPVHPSSVDTEQYRALNEFKKSCKQRGLIEEYENLSEFKQKFSRQLAQAVIRELSSDEDAEDPLIAVFPDAPSIRLLSEDARQLLTEAVKDQNGIILFVSTLDGLNVQTNNRKFIEDGRSPREQARWKAAVEELEESDLIEDRGYNREIFHVTDEGYRVADTLSPG